MDVLRSQADEARLQEMSMVRMLLTERVVAFNPVIAKITKDVKAALFLCQLMYWSDKGHDERGWIYKTRDEWEDETAMGRREQESARSKLRSLDLIEEAQHGTNRVLYYRVKWESLHGLLTAVSQGYKSAQSKGQTVGPIDEAESDFSIRKSETTTENTTDIYSDVQYPWLGVLREIPGWKERGEPMVEPLMSWVKEKGYAPEFLKDHAIGVSSQGAKGLKGSNNLARKFQNACNSRYYVGRNGGGAQPQVTDEDRLEQIRKAKA